MAVVHVVMGNDFPQAVFDTLEAAEAYCVLRRAEKRLDQRHIYWRVYDFNLNKATT